MDALVEDMSLCQLSDSPDPANFEEHAPAQAYIADTLTTAEHIRQSECIDHGLHRMAI